MVVAEAILLSQSLISSLTVLAARVQWLVLTAWAAHVPGPANTNTEVPVKFLPFKLSPVLSSMVRARPRPG